jgi:hypothetical protein
MSEAILDWERIVHKNVRSKDMQDAGNVAAVDNNSIIILSEGAKHEYKIPKSRVAGYNGAEIFLDIPYSNLSNFEVRM